MESTPLTSFDYPESSIREEKKHIHTHTYMLNVILIISELKVGYMQVCEHTDKHF